ncbi:restriction endonuclease subunit S [Segetibacter sp. 3557_3]|uniref:restriction endonuclease subunit S n=1 Tax=Segetibacter sp. 3557_3 TaxID=2547429 RepID=UPI0010586916|nr:restriction endonuclease subunit S [Segetibacter sp. 3557_3]TDH26784.1 restriction endonuclease subunit S [Segetibacter sp. 3557_3]
MIFSGWRQVKLGEISSKITKGTTPTTLGERFVDEGVNFIKAESVTFDGTIDKSKFVYITPDTHEKLKRSQLEEGDILFSMAGMVLGKTAVVTSDLLPANTNQALALIRLKKAEAFPRFIDYFMRQSSFFHYVNSSTGQSAQPNINLQEIGDLTISLPSLAVQKRIASILSSLDNKIELNRQTNQTLEAIAQALFKEWFVDFNFPGAPGEFQDSELGRIPKEWKVGKLGDLLNFRNGKPSPERSDNYQFPVYGANGIIGFAETSNAEEKSIIIGRVGSFCGAVYFNLENSYVTDNAIIGEPNRVKTSMFCFLLAKSLNLNNYRVGSGQPLLNQAILSGIKIVIPSESILKVFEKVTLSIFQFSFQKQKEINVLIELRDTLLPKLMKGEMNIQK